jgi:large subunit ribosomal protein L23
MAEKKTTSKTEKPVNKAKPTKAEKPMKKEVKKEKKTEVKPIKREVKMEVISLKPLITEKAVMMIESQNTLTFETSINSTRTQIKEEVEEIFDVKVEDVRTLIRKAKKYAYVRLNTKTPAIDIATKLGMI